MSMVNPPIVLSIAGTDPSGGAGIQADIKAISATASFATSVVTALVAQNTQGVSHILEIPPHFIVQQANAVFVDMTVSAVKIGMLHREEVIFAVSDILERWKPPHVVFDPVMVAKDGSKLLTESAISSLKSAILPKIDLLTPNRHEAEELIGAPIDSDAMRVEALKTLSAMTKGSVLLKGGHFDDEMAEDYFFDSVSHDIHCIPAPRIETNNTHGTGCTLSSAIASYLAQGFSMFDAICRAKKYVTEALIAAKGQTLGKGKGPLHHFYFLLKES